MVRQAVGEEVSARTPDAAPQAAESLAERSWADGVAALDVGGTSIKFGLVGRDGAVHDQGRQPTGTRRGPEAVIDTVLDLAADLAADPRVRGIGICVPGIVDSAAGIAKYSANIGWREVPFADLLSARTSKPATLGHDVRSGALAEARIGAGSGSDSVYFLAIGTGVAGSEVVGGQVRDGASGQAGEIGHLVVRHRGPRCGCGGRGCLEAIASASRIAAGYRRRARKRGSAADVARLVREGDPIAVDVWNGAVAALADALAAQIVLTDPGHIVIGGGLSLAGETLLGPLRSAVGDRLTFRGPPPVTAAQLGDRAGMIGAALRAWDMLDANEMRRSMG